MSHITRTGCRILLLILVWSLVALPNFTPEALAQQPEPAVVEREPNSRLSQATEIAVPTQLQAPIDPVGDVDWYTFSVPQDGELQIAVTNMPANVVVNLQVFNADASSISGWIGPSEKGGDTVASLDLPEAGRYYVELADDYSDASSPQPYTMAVSFTPAVDAGEPNNRLNSATPLTFDEPRSATIFPRGDVDWYTFSVPQDGELQITITNAPADLGMSLLVFNADGSAISGWIGPAEKGGDTVATLDLPEAGHYYVEVADDYGDARSLQPYTITAVFTPAVDAGEPNNRLNTATPLTFDEPLSAVIFPKGDVDWYVLSVPQDGELQITVTKVPTDVVVNLQVFNADGSSISGWIGPPEEGGNTVATLDLSEAGHYYVELADDYSDARSLQPYTITAVFTPAVDAGEPNNRLSSATLVALGKPLSAVIFPKGDVDWYAFNVPQDGELQIAVTNMPANVVVNVQVFNPDASSISSWIGPPEKGSDTVATLDLPEAGRYYVELADDYSDARSLQPYAMAVTFTAAVDAGEPNNRLSRATPLTFNEPRSATIFPKGDVDWYTFSVPQDGKLQITVTNAPADLGMSLLVFNADGSAISGWIGPPEKGSNTVATLDLPEAGRYYVEVADDYSDARSLQPYTITAVFAPGRAP